MAISRLNNHCSRHCCHYCDILTKLTKSSVFQSTLNSCDAFSISYCVDLIVLMSQEVERLRQQLELCEKNLNQKRETVKILLQQVCTLPAFSCFSRCARCLHLSLFCP